MNYEVFGEPIATAERVFLGIHGWGGGTKTFVPLLPYLPAGIALVSVDMPGYGPSPRPAEWSVEHAIQPLVELIDELPGDLELLGNCSGAIFGMCAAQLRPERFKRLVLIDPFAYFPWYFRLLLVPGFGRLFYATAFQNPIGRILTNLGLAKHRGEGSDLTASFNELDHDVVYQYLVLLWEVGGYQRFATLESVPEIELLIGEKTFRAIRHSVELWKGIWPQAVEHICVGAGHLPIEETSSTLSRFAFGSSGADQTN